MRSQKAGVAFIALLALASFFAVSARPADAARIKLLDAHIVSHIDGTGVADDTPKYPTREETVTLYLALKARLDGRVVYFTNAPSISLGGSEIPADSLKRWDEGYGYISIRWFKLEPRDKYLDNTEGGWHWQKVRHAQRIFNRGAWQVSADTVPTILETRADTGTMRFRVKVGHNRKGVSSPGASAYGKTGIDESVHRVSVRGTMGVPIIDWAYSFMNLPYIHGSDSPGGEPGNHQAERYIGADSADFVTAAARGAGYEIEYGSTAHLWPDNERGYTEYVSRDPRLLGKDGIYREEDEKVVFGPGGVAPGDLVIFNRRHVGILVKDSPPMGYLSADDTIIHALWREPREESVSDAFPPPFSIVRLKEALKR